jgi:hypothetical protein
MRRAIRFPVTGVMALALAFSAGGCLEQSLLGPESVEVEEVDFSLLADGDYSETAARTLHYQFDSSVYDGGNVAVQGGTIFHLKEGALTPPAATEPGEDITITMLVERDKTGNALLFTFGPSGCSFDPPAEMWFDWNDLGSPKATLYYINPDGVPVEQAPDEVDLQGKRVKLYIDHFSRYALARSR